MCLRSLAALALCLVACEATAPAKTDVGSPPSAEDARGPAVASTSPDGLGRVPLTAEQSLDGMSFLKAQSAFSRLLYSLERRTNQNASTGDSIEVEGERGDLRARAFYQRYATLRGAEEHFEAHTLGSLWVMKGQRLLAVRVERAGELDLRASRELLDALVSEAARDEPFVHVKTEAKWLSLGLEKDHGRLVIAPTQVKKLLAALAKLGHPASVKWTSERDLKNAMDATIPGVGIVSEGEGFELDLSCYESEKFVRQPDEAGLGNAIWMDGRCSVVARFGGDKDKAGTLLSALLAAPDPG